MKANTSANLGTLAGRFLGPFASKRQVRAAIVPLAFALAGVAGIVSGVVVPELRSATRARVRLARDHYAVSSEHRKGTQVGLAALRQGAGAVDTAITMALALGVVQPSSSGIGGGGFALVFEGKTGRTTALDFRETAPRDVDPTELEYRPTKPYRTGRGRMIGVPGEIAGLVELHRRFGRRPFAEDVAPAIELAERGYVASLHLETLSRAYHEELAWSPPLAQVFLPGGIPVVLGSWIRNSPLAATLRCIASKGTEGFYRGPIAEEIVATARSVGGHLSMADLADYRAVERRPLRFSWEGYEVLSMPAPSGGGLLLAEVFGMLSKGDLQQLRPGSSAWIHLLAEAFRLAMVDRAAVVGDPAFASDDFSSLLAPARLAELRAQIGLDATRPIPPLVIRESGTAHLIVADAEGTVIGLTTTINDAFGAKVVTPQSGIILNNELDDFSPLKGPLLAGLTSSSQAGPNVPRPRARPASSMTPTLVLQGGAPILAAGGSGGLRIATGVAQAVLRRLVHQDPLWNCVAEGRFHTPPSGGLELEFPPSSTQVQRELAARGERVTVVPNYSAVQMISWERLPPGRDVAERVRPENSGGLRLEAVADPRKGGGGVVE